MGNENEGQPIDLHISKKATERYLIEGAMLLMKEGMFRLTFWDDTINDQKQVCCIVNAQPKTMKEFAENLTEAIKLYEARYGDIPKIIPKQTPGSNKEDVPGYR